ncbi:transposase, partial [Candidatus Fermentibacteria bacterium]
MIDPGKIPEEEKTPLVTELLHAIQALREDVQCLRDEIARLKQHKGKPKIPPSRLEKDQKEKKEKKKDANGKRPGSEKRSKTKDLTIHETIPVPPKNIPLGSIRVGHNEWIVQGLEIKVHNVCYQLEHWITPEGRLLKGELPDSVNGHFSAMLRSFALQQYNHGCVTQPLILEELLDFGVNISSGQVNRILTEQKDAFHLEKAGILCAGLNVSNYINVDDTGARHAGRNGYCTHIGNEFFAWFESTGSKSRINFLQLLRNGHCDYVINEDAIEYIQRQSFPKPLLARLTEDVHKHLAIEADWKQHLEQLGIKKDRHVRIATEGALLGSVLHHGFSKEVVIIS